MALPILDGNQTATTLSTVLTSGEHIPAHTVVSLGSTAISNITSAVSGSVVSISNFPSTQTIAGTVTANATLAQDVIEYFDESAASHVVAVHIKDAANNIIGSGGVIPISGTVTAFLRSEYLDTEDQNCVRAVAHTTLQSGEAIAVQDNFPLPIKVQNSVTIGANPSGALTTRFGSVTTANTAQITSAVTNTNRKYLLAQNISAGTVTIGIGFSPTTTQGIQLTAGGGLTFDAFCPTGAVYWLGAVTGAAFTILEG